VDCPKWYARTSVFSARFRYNLAARGGSLRGRGFALFLHGKVQKAGSQKNDGIAEFRLVGGSSFP